MAEATIQYSTRAVDQLEDLEIEDAKRIVSKLDDVTWNVKHYLERQRMSGESYNSLHIDDYRVILDWRPNEGPGILFIQQICPRSHIYN